MADRPSRNRRAPKRLEKALEDDAEDVSVIAVSQPFVSKSRKLAPKSKGEDTLLEPLVPTVRGRGSKGNRSRGTGTRTPDGHDGSELGTENLPRTAKRQRVRGHSNDNSNIIVATGVSTSSVEVDAGLRDRSRFDEGYGDGAGDVPLLPAKRTTHLLPNIPTEDEATIEQWYADPYERVDPDGPGYDEWRYRNIINNLYARGFHHNRAKQIASWLMRCNGRFRPFEEPKKRTLKNISNNGRKRKRGEDAADSQASQDRYSQTPNNAVELRGGDVLENDQTAALFEDESDLDWEESGSLAGSVTGLSTLTPSSSKNEKVPAQSKQKGSRGRSRAPSTISCLTRTAVSNAAKARSPSIDTALPSLEHEPHYDDLDVDAQIAIIKDRLRTFEIVYGDELPNPDEARYDIDYMSRITTLPRSVPKHGFKTQGHQPLRHVIVPKDSEALNNHLIRDKAVDDYYKDAKLKKPAEGTPNEGLWHNQSRPHNSEVLVEDPHFGLNPLPRSQILTREEQTLLSAQADRKALRASRPGDDSPHSNGKATRAAEAEANDLERALVQEQLRVKVFPWENQHTMAAIPTDDSGQSWDNMWLVKEDNEKWKRLRERLEILQGGGETAERLLAEGEERRIEEERKAKRRVEAARAKERKRQKILGLDEMDGGPSGLQWSVDD